MQRYDYERNCNYIEYTQIFEVSHAKNVQYDLEKITEKVDEI